MFIISFKTSKKKILNELCDNTNVNIFCKYVINPIIQFIIIFIITDIDL